MKAINLKFKRVTLSDTNQMILISDTFIYSFERSIAIKKAKEF